VRLVRGLRCECIQGLCLRVLMREGSGGNSFRALQMMGLGEDYAKVAGRSVTIYWSYL
jgi:hypothetical protein